MKIEMQMKAVVKNDCRVVYSGSEQKPKLQIRNSKDIDFVPIFQGIQRLI